MPPFLPHDHDEIGRPPINTQMQVHSSWSPSSGPGPGPGPGDPSLTLRMQRLYTTGAMAMPPLTDKQNSQPANPTNDTPMRRSRPLHLLCKILMPPHYGTETDRQTIQDPSMHSICLPLRCLVLSTLFPILDRSFLAFWPSMPPFPCPGRPVLVILTIIAPFTHLEAVGFSSPRIISMGLRCKDPKKGLLLT